MSETLGKGYRTELDGLAIHTEVGPQSWFFVIYRDGVKIAGHDPVWPDNWNEDGAKREAVERALQILRRDEDLQAVLKSLRWESYGPGHQPQE